MTRPARITSDGTGLGTKVFDADGNEIKGCISAIEWSIVGGGGLAKAVITMENVQVDVIGQSPGAQSGETKDDDHVA